MDQLIHWNSKVRNGSFLLSGIAQERAFSRRKLKILFSDKPGLEKRIRRGFRYTHHEIAFGEFSPELIMNYDLVVPITIQDVKYLDEVRYLIVDNQLPIPSLASVVLCDDKYQLNQRLIDNGFGDAIPRMGGELAYPYMRKKRIDEWGRSCQIIRDLEDEQTHAGILTDPDYFSQELVAGSIEYATHVLFKGGKIMCCLNMKYTFGTTTPIKGQDTVLDTRICRGSYLDLFSALLKSIDFEGLCCVNYKVRDNRPMILEVNPRFGGSLASFFVCFIKYINPGK